MKSETTKVLIIDNDEDDYILTRELFSLVKVGEYALDWASSYEEGLDVARRLEHQVCLVDYHLGERSGADLIREARESRLTTPMILFTGSGDHDVDVEAMKAGATDYLVKGETSPSRLERAIRYGVQRNTERKRAEEMMVRLASIVESSEDAIFSKTLDGVITSWNKGAERLYGYSLTEAMGRSVSELMPPTRTDEMPLILGRVSRGERIQHFETTRLKKNGEQVDVSLTVSPMKNGSGAIIGASTIARDIKKRRQAEEAQHATEARFRLVIEASPNAIIMANEQGRITLVNAETEHLFGYERAELLNQPLEMLVPERYRAAHPGHRQLFAENPSTRTIGGGRDLYGLRKDGKEVPIEIGLNPIRTDEGAFVLASIIDITNRKREEQVLRESEERLETIIENLHEGLVISDLNGQLTHFNQAGLEMHGFSSLEEGLLKLPQFHKMFELSSVDGPVLEFEEWPLARVMAGEVLTDYEVCLRRIDKDWQAIFSYGGALVKAPNGQPLAFLTITDITKRKRIEGKLKLYSDRLERSNRELQDFAQVASHDLQEPLRKILAFGDRLKARAGESLDEECRDYLQRMFSAAARMQTLITELLTFSRVETKAQTFVAVDLGVIAKEVSADLETLIEKTGGRVEVEELPTIDADPVQMRQLLQNLIGNSLKYFRVGVPPVVRIYSEELDERRCESITKSGGLAGQLTQIFVADNGIGFDEKYLDRIFNMFQRLHQRGEYEGTGVGLAICRKIVDRHVGTITARSRPGEGTTFVVTMPFTQPKEVKVL